MRQISSHQIAFLCLAGLYGSILLSHYAAEKGLMVWIKGK